RLLELAAGAAVLLENHLPGRMEAWGVGPHQLCGVNTRLVWVGMRGSRDPAAAALPGHDLTYLAGAGLLNALEPAWRQLPLADLCGAFWAALAVERGLRLGGGVFEVFLEDAAHAAAWPPIPGLDGSRCCYAVYAAAVGEVALAALEPHLWQRFCRAAHRPEWADAAAAPTASSPGHAHAHVHAQMCAFFRLRPAPEWEAWAQAEGIPLRALASPQPAARLPLPWRMA
ncbi:MAG: CoA transferase, partial [Terriglobales bacterium]